MRFLDSQSRFSGFREFGFSIQRVRRFGPIPETLCSAGIQRVCVSVHRVCFFVRASFAFGHAKWLLGVPSLLFAPRPPRKELASLHLRPEDPGAPYSRAEKEAWRQRALAWLGDAIDEEQPAEQKHHRLPAQHLLLSLDHALQQGVDRRISDFREPPQAEVPAEAGRRGQRRATLTLAMDQCSVNWCMLWFLIYQLKCHILYIVDHSHRLWNDVKVAIAACGWWGHIILSTWMMNVLHGPYDGCKFYGDMSHAAKEYASLATEDDPLLQSFARGLLHDRGELYRAMEPDILSVLLQRVRNSVAWKRIDERTSLNRWFQWVWRAFQTDTVWHERVVVQVFLGLQCGHIKKAAKGDYKLSGPVHDADAASSSSAKAEEQDLGQSLRARR